MSSAAVTTAPTSRPWVKICGVTRTADAAAAAALGADLIGLNFWSGSPRRVDLDRAREIAAAARSAAPDGAIRIVGVFVNEAPARVDELVGAAGLDFVQLHGDEPPGELARWGARLVRVVRGGFFVAGPDAGGGGLPADGIGAAGVGEKLALKGELGLGGAARGDRQRLGASRKAGGKAGEAASDSSLPSLPAATAGPRSLSLQQNAFTSVLPDLTVGPAPFAYLLDVPRARGSYGGGGVAWAWESAQEWVATAERPVLVAGGVRPGNAAAALRRSGAAGVDVASGVESAPGIKDRELMRRLIEEVRGVATSA